MGSLTRKFANNFTTGGLYKAAAINNASLDNVTAIPAAAKGKLTLISSQTASASASISFTSGIDSTYPIYKFEFINIHSSADTNFSFNFSTDGGSNYNVTKTSTAFEASHRENGTDGTLGYNTNRDLAQSTAFQVLSDTLSSANNDANLCGKLYLFNPSSTTYVKHYMATTNFDDPNSPQYTFNYYIAGYGNTTSAINAVQFKQSSGNIDAGTIKMYGISA